MNQVILKCTVCALPFSDSVHGGSTSKNSRFAKRKLMEIFCQHFDLSIGSRTGFDFCFTCKDQIRRLCLLEKRLGETQSEIRKVVAHLTCKIIDTQSNVNNQTDFERTLEIQSRSEDDYHVPAEFSAESQSVRKIICENYLPQVIVTPYPDIPTFSPRKRKCVQPLNFYSLLYDDDETWEGDRDNVWKPTCVQYDSIDDDDDNFVIDNKKRNICSTSKTEETVGTTNKKFENTQPRSSSTEKKMRRQLIKRVKREDKIDQKKISGRRRKKKSSFRFGKQIKTTTTSGQRPKVRMQKLIRQGEFSFMYGSWKLEQDPVTQYFRCLTCGNTRKSRGDIIRHINVKHNTERASCKVCGKSWENPKRLEDHNCRPKSEDKRRRCKVLPQGQFLYVKKWAFEKVKKDDDNDTTYKCHTCKSIAPSLPQMYAHLSHRHENPNKYVCDICGRHYALKSTFLAHQTIHNESRDIVCHICGKNFRTKNVLAAHMQGHQDRRWVCEICGKSFKYSKGLGKHRRDVFHFKRTADSQLQDSQQQQESQEQPSQSQQVQLPANIVEGIERIDKTDIVQPPTLPTDYSLTHLIFQEKLHAEYTQSLRNLQF